MGTVWVDALPRLFARRAAEELAKSIGVEDARSRIAARLAEAEPAEARMFRDILDALDAMPPAKRH